MNGPEDEASGAGPEVVACAECGTDNPAETTFCTQCGVKLVAPRKNVGRGRRRKAGDAAQRSRTRQEFGRIKQTVLTVRSIFWACAALAAGWLGLWHFFAAAEGLELTSTVGMVITVLLWGQLVLLIAGAIYVLRAPLVWTTIGACYWSLNTVVVVLAAGGMPGPMDVAQAFVAVAFWFGVAQAARVQRFMAEDPSLQLVRKRLAPEQRVVGGVGDDVRARRKRERRSAWRGRLRVLGMAAVVLLVAGFAIYKVTRPTPVDATVQTFGKRWSLHDVDGVCSLFDTGATGSLASSLREELEQRGWSAALPPLGDAQVETRGDRAVVRWPLGKSEVLTRFVRSRDVWQLDHIALPPVDAPAPDDAVAAFVAAWEGAGTDALVDSFRPASRERVGGSLRRMLERREWHEQRPALGARDVGPVRAGRCRVLFTIEHDELRVNFEYWHPRWYVVGVALPRS
ncbi:MAG: hypothetical protein KDC48_06135 [Planctomycetes bacterium]|nr:hypothetical protein [Planctomycetota bacterium]